MSFIAAGTTSVIWEISARLFSWSLSALAGISSYEPSELVVTVRAGTPLAELEATLAARGQCLPFEPPHFAPGGTPRQTGAPVGGTPQQTVPPVGGTVGGMVTDPEVYDDLKDLLRDLKRNPWKLMWRE